jgi:hypothetical protein
MKWLLLLTPINTRFELCNHVVARVGFFVVVVIVAITRSTWILLALLDTFGLRTFGFWPAGKILLACETDTFGRDNEGQKLTAARQVGNQNL